MSMMGGALVSTRVSGPDGIPVQAQNVNQQHPAAGLVALPAAVAAYRLAGGTPDDDTLQLVRRALTAASAEAAAALADRVGGDAIAAVLADAHCSVMTELGSDADAGSGSGSGSGVADCGLVSAHDAGRLLLALVTGRLCDEAAAEAIEALMREHVERDGLPLGLPEDVSVANLVARADGVRHDVAVVRAEGREPVVICVLTGGLDDDEAEWRTSDLARYLWESLPA